MQPTNRCLSGELVRHSFGRSEVLCIPRGPRRLGPCRLTLRLGGEDRLTMLPLRVKRGAAVRRTKQNMSAADSGRLGQQVVGLRLSNQEGRKKQQ